jgi:hypothetical protein
MQKPLSFKLVLFLAIVQGIAALLRAFNWVQIGVDLFGQGVLLLPLIGAVAVMRGVIISAVPILYVIFVVGALLGKGWAWWFCLWAVIINLLLILGALFRGGVVVEAIAWSLIPIILSTYLFSQMGRSALKAT